MITPLQVTIAQFIYNNTATLPMHIGKLLLDGHLKTPFNTPKIQQYYRNIAVLLLYHNMNGCTTIMPCLAIYCDVTRASAKFIAHYLLLRHQRSAPLYPLLRHNICGFLADAVYRI